MARGDRIRAFGGSCLLVVAGIVVGFVVRGILGEVLATVLIGVGAIALVSLAFLEVGLGEDHELEHEAELLRERRLRGVRLRGTRPRRPS